MKVLKVYYKGSCQELSVADGTESDEIFQMMKRIFHIEEDLSDFFFQDSEGRIVILPKKLPKELSLFLYVRQNMVQTVPAPTLPPKQSYKWTLKCTEGTENQLEDGIHYHYINSPDMNKPPYVISSIAFSEGKHYTVIKVDSAHRCSMLGFGIPGCPPEYFANKQGTDCHTPEFEHKPFFVMWDYEFDRLTKLIGIAIDQDSKTCYFLQVNPETFEPFQIEKEVTDIPSSIILYAGVKNWRCFEPPCTGITIIKDSLPFPNLSKMVPKEKRTWNQ